MSEEKPTKALLEDIELVDNVLFLDQYDEAYIAINGDGGQIYKINSSKFKEWMSTLCWERYEHMLNQQDTNNLIQVLSGIARRNGKRYSLSVRYADAKSALWYDRGAGEEAVRISGAGWKLISKQPILFRRPSHQRPQVVPLKDGNIKKLLDYVNLKTEADQLLFLVYVVAAFIPDFPHPLLIFHGPQGAGKSTPMRVMKKLIDPSALHGMSAPHDVAAFVQTAHHHGFLFYDNLSNLPTWFSDALARTSTGDSFSKRKLYTNDDDVIYTLQRPIAMNGINQIVTKPDLLDRSILLKLERIPSHERLTEKEFWKRFDEDCPVILGSIFDVLARAMKLYPTVELGSMPRMADFARWGYAIAEAAGFTGNGFVEAYEANIAVQNDEAIEASMVAQAVIILMNESDSWEGSPTDLLSRLDKIALLHSLDKSYLWPKGPVWLTRRLNEVQPNLAARGILVEHVSTADGRVTQITRMPDFTENTDNADED